MVNLESMDRSVSTPYQLVINLSCSLCVAVRTWDDLMVFYIHIYIHNRELTSPLKGHISMDIQGNYDILVKEYGGTKSQLALLPISSIQCQSLMLSYRSILQGSSVPPTRKYITGVATHLADMSNSLIRAFYSTVGF